MFDSQFLCRVDVFESFTFLFNGNISAFRLIDDFFITWHVCVVLAAEEYILGMLMVPYSEMLMAVHYQLFLVIVLFTVGALDTDVAVCPA